MESNELAQDVWPLLRRNTDYVPEHISDSKRRGARYQVFEVLITWIITEQNRDFDWTVTPVQGDGGVDFIGRRSLLKVPGQSEFVPEFTIIGQCKVRNQNRVPGRSRDDAHAQLESDFRRSLKIHSSTNRDRPTPRIFIGCLADKIPKSQRVEAEESLSRLTTASVTVLDLDDIVTLIANRMDLLCTVLENSDFSTEEVARLIEYFSEVDGSGGSVTVTAMPQQDVVYTNDVAAFSLHVSSPRALPATLSVSHILPDGSSIELLGHNRSGTYTLRPSDDDIRFASEVILFRTPSVGAQSLGQIRLEYPSGETREFDLGEFKAEYSFRHAFYWTEHARTALERFSDLLRKESMCSACPIFGVVGAGGSGKSRLIEEILFHEKLHDWRSFTLRQSKDANHPYKLILDLLSFVSIGETEFHQSHRLSILGQLSLLHGSTGRAAASAFDALTQSSKDSLDAEALALSLAALLRNNLRRQSTILHFADMHQAPPDVLSFIGRLASLITMDSNVYVSRLAFIVEGRDASQLDRVNRDFERQLNIHAEDVYTLPPLDTETQDFIDHILEASLNRKIAPAPERTAQFKGLKRRIARVCGGNPMFIIETIRLLVERGYLRADPRTGALYLLQNLPDTFELPASIEDCLIARLVELKRNAPDLAELVIACGTLDDNLDIRLFEDLCQEIAPSSELGLIFSMGILAYTFNANLQSAVRFSHEYYFQVVHGLDPEDHNKAQIYNVFRTHILRKTKSAQRLFDQARIEGLADEETPEQLEARFKSAWAMANETEQGYLEYRIGKHVSELWLTKMNMVHQQVSNARLSTRHAELLLRYDDRQNAVHWLSSLLDALKNNRQLVSQVSKEQNIDSDYLSAQVLTALGNAMLNQFFGYLAVENISRAVKLTSEAMTNKSDLHDPMVTMWQDLHVNALDRLGCALRIEGKLADANTIARRALESARLNPTGLSAMHAIFDFGRLYALESPEGAFGYFDEARAILSSADSDLKRHALMIGVSEESAKILLLDQSGTLKDLQTACVERVESLAYSSYGLEVGASLLNASAAFIGSDATQALTYAEAAINWNMERNYLELLWKSHHNAIVASLALNDRNLAEYHIQRCFNLIFEQDINNRPEPFKRQRLVRFEPTLHLLSDASICAVNSISAYVQMICNQAPNWVNLTYQDYIAEFSERRRGVEAARIDDKIVYAF